MLNLLPFWPLGCPVKPEQNLGVPPSAATLSQLAARWREIGAALARHPDSPTLTAEAQRVGSELLTECRRQGVSPVLAMLDEGEA